MKTLTLLTTLRTHHTYPLLPFLVNNLNFKDSLKVEVAYESLMYPYETSYLVLFGLQEDQTMIENAYPNFSMFFDSFEDFIKKVNSLAAERKCLMIRDGVLDIISFGGVENYTNPIQFAELSRYDENLPNSPVQVQSTDFEVVYPAEEYVESTPPRNRLKSFWKRLF